MMKQGILGSILVGLLVVGLSVAWTGCGDDKAKDHDKGKPEEDHGKGVMYACPMKEHKKQYDKPGKCEVKDCGMTLEPMKHHEKGGEEAGHGHESAAKHGGQVVMTPIHHFEVQFLDDGIHVYLYDKEQKPMSFKGVSGNIQLEIQGKPKREVALSYMAMKKGDVSPDCLKAKTDLKGVKPGTLKAVISITGLKGHTGSFAVKNAAHDE